MAHRFFNGLAHAASYWKHRVPPSDELVQLVLQFLGKHKGRPFELAVDVGCGPGQGTLLLAKHFDSVVGTDVSPAQLELALQHSKEKNITYRECLAEELPFADSSVDLVTAMSAFHWFDRPRFLQEVDRVLKPRGCLALLSYAMEMEIGYQDCCSHTLNQVCEEFYEAMKPYRNPCLGATTDMIYRAAYEAIPYPVKEWEQNKWVRRSMPLYRVIGILETFTAYQALLREDPQRATDLSQDMCERLMSIMKVTSAETEVMVGIRYYYVLACKPKEP